MDVTVCEDGSPEFTETASVHLTNLANATPGDTSGLLSILNDSD